MAAIEAVDLPTKNTDLSSLGLLLELPSGATLELCGEAFSAA
jgi:hypothetical protein